MLGNSKTNFTRQLVKVLSVYFFMGMLIQASATDFTDSLEDADIYSIQYRVVPKEKTKTSLKVVIVAFAMGKDTNIPTLKGEDNNGKTDLTLTLESPVRVLITSDISISDKNGEERKWEDALLQAGSKNAELKTIFEKSKAEFDVNKSVAVEFDLVTWNLQNEKVIFTSNDEVIDSDVQLNKIVLEINMKKGDKGKFSKITTFAVKEVRITGMTHNYTEPFIPIPVKDFAEYAKVMKALGVDAKTGRDDKWYKSWWFIVLVIAIVLVIIVLIVLAFMKSNEKI